MIRFVEQHILMLAIVAGVATTGQVYWLHSGYAVTSYIFDFAFGFLVAAFSFFVFRNYMAKTQTSLLANIVFSGLLGLGLDLYFSYFTFDFFCPQNRLTYNLHMWLNDSCSGWPIFIDFHYRTWPWFALGNFVLWSVGAYILLLIITSRPNNRAQVHI